MGDRTGKSYEELATVVFQTIVNQSELRNIMVEHDVTLQGRSTSHQIDIYWKFAVGILAYETIIQTKDWKNPVDQGELIKFKGVLDDLPGQPKGIFVSRAGFQQGAIDFARQHGILVYEFCEADEEPIAGVTTTGWARCTLVNMPLRAILRKLRPRGQAL